jgi:hypothetical protein
MAWLGRGGGVCGMAKRTSVTALKTPTRAFFMLYYSFHDEKLSNVKTKSKLEITMIRQYLLCHNCPIKMIKRPPQTFSLMQKQR